MMTVKKLRALLKGLPGSHKVLIGKDDSAIEVKEISDAHMFHAIEYGKWETVVYYEKEIMADTDLEYKENAVVLLPKERKIKK